MRCVENHSAAVSSLVLRVPRILASPLRGWVVSSGGEVDAISSPTWDPLPYPTTPSRHLEARFISVFLFLGSGLTILCSTTHLMVNPGCHSLAHLLLRASVEGPLSVALSYLPGVLSHAFFVGRPTFVSQPSAFGLCLAILWALF